MFARVARFEGADAETLNRTTDRIREQAEAAGGPPEGVPSNRLLVLKDPEGGQTLVISMFETAADYEEGDRTLGEMSPPRRRPRPPRRRRQIRGRLRGQRLGI